MATENSFQRWEEKRHWEYIVAIIHDRQIFTDIDFQLMDSADDPQKGYTIFLSTKSSQQKNDLISGVVGDKMLLKLRLLTAFKKQI